MSGSLHSFWILAAAAALAVSDLPAVSAAEPVDVELVLAVDVSLSMSPGELEIQRRGYATALVDPQVLKAIADGAYGRIAVSYFEWAGATTQHVIIPWTIIGSREDAERVAARLSVHTPNSARRTSISGALEFGSDLFAESPYHGMKRVIDISGDGPNNQGGPVSAARDAIIAQGIIVNGLPLLTTGGFSSAYDVENLDAYYRDCVIGGPGAFMVPVNDWSQFPEAIRRKLVLELAFDETPRYTPHTEEFPVVLAQDKPSVDCLAGEKMWRDRSLMFESK